MSAASPPPHALAPLSDDARLVSDFEQGRVPGDFHHADHVRVAFAYVSELPLLDAIAKFSAALRRFATGRGKPNLYHQTITWAYLLIIAERIARAGSPHSWEDFAANNPDVLMWKGGVLDRHYKKSTLDSDLAKKVFVLPDRAPGSTSPAASLRAWS
ncbi:MAG: hypothetical protein WBQ72_05240 [Terriglobales bacterium]|jgi:hypothetical protein